MSGLQQASDSRTNPAPPSLGAQAVWLLAAKSVGFAFAIALPLVLVRRLSQLDFGVYKQIFLVVGTAVTVLPLGFGMSAFYFLPRERARQGAIVTNIILFHASVGLLLALVLTAFPELLAWVFNSPALAAHARLTAVVVVLWTTGTFLEIAPVAMQDVRASTGLIITNQLSKTALLMSAAVTVGTVRALIIAAIVHGIVQVALMLAYLQWRLPGFWRAFDLQLLWRQATYALPVGGSSLLLKLQDDVHHAFVSNVVGPAAYAIYAIGVFKLPLVGILRESVGSVVLPRINELETRNARRQILELVASAARKLSLVYIPAYALLMVTGREVITVLFTEKYVDSWPIFAISISYLPFGIVVLDPVTRAHSERYFFLALRLSIFSLLVLVLWQYAAVLGMVGVIAAVVIANISDWSIAVFRMARLLQAGRRDLVLFGDIGRVAAAAALAAAVTATVRLMLLPGPSWRVLLVCGPVFAVVYLMGIVRARVLRREEASRLVREVVRSVVRRKTWKTDGRGHAHALGSEPGALPPVTRR